MEPRFADLVRRLTDATQTIQEEGAKTREALAGVEPMVASYAASSGESLTFVGTQLRELLDEVRALSARADEDEPTATSVTTHDSAFLGRPFALRALAGVEPPARVLDVGGAESTLAMELATLGFEVVGIDRRDYLHEHPGLTSANARLADLDADTEPFGAAVCLHGLGGADADDPWAADADLLRRLRALLTENGIVVLSLPAGTGVSGGHAHYDERRLAALLDGWDVRHQLYLREQLPGTWRRAESPAGRSVVLVAASPT
jgi:2-polyprenyl-3-methyl-5-hydroxy-6-metoxy-1,4-benzoquinol methylase